MQEYFLLLRTFWERHPALFIGFSLLLGTGWAFYPHIVLLLPALFLLSCKQRAWQSIFLSLVAFGYAHMRYPSQHLENALAGKAHIAIHTVTLGNSPFHRSFAYRGTIKKFTSSEGEIFHNLPFSLYLPLQSKRLPAYCDYVLEGTLSLREGGRFLFKPEKNSTWVPVEGTFSLAEWRFNAKNRVRKYLKKHISDPQASTFLTALAIGEIDERLLAYQFNHLGLQHILAISGFHFGLIAFFCGFILRFLLPRKIALGLLLALLSGYFFFLGNAPSVQRAWIALALVLLARLYNLRTTAINAIGVGLSIELLIDPSVIGHLGFQLSFLATFGILLLYSPMEKLCCFLFIKRPLAEVWEMSWLDKHGYLFASLTRKTLAINLAVHAVALPVLLGLFHKFPVLSLVYNLFLPFWVGAVLFLLLLASLATAVIPPLGILLHATNSFLTSKLLLVTSHPPACLDLVLYVKTFPFPLVIAILCALFGGGVYFSKSR